MSTNTIGRSKHFDRYWSGNELHLENGIQFHNLRSESALHIGDIEGYPYENQMRFFGDFTYQMPPAERGETYEPKGTFEYRCSSGLFLVNTEASHPSHEKVIAEINEQVSRDAEIEEALSIPRDKLWTLLEQADSVDPLIIFGPEGRYDVNDLLMVLRRSEGDPLQKLENLHDQEQVEDYHSLVEIISELDIPENVQSLSDLDIDLYRNRISYAEAEFSHLGKFATLTYDRGSVQINAMNESVREYTIQLIERDLIYEID